MYEGEVEEVDKFVAEYKALVGPMPEWGQHRWGDWQIRWGIEDALGIERGELCLTCDWRYIDLTICCMFKQQLIYRLDIVPGAECKPNPLGAYTLGLPHQVCGPHIHGWSDNREYVMKNGFGTLPYRRPIDGLVQTFPDALGWIAEHLNLTITGEQRLCELPPQMRLV